MARRSCKWGALKHPSRGRVCKKPPRRRRAFSNRSCKWGRLKRPVGGRICRSRGSSRGGGSIWSRDDD